MKTHCPKGHSYAKHGTKRSDTGYYRCLKCARLNEAAKRKANPQAHRDKSNRWYHNHVQQSMDQYRERRYGLSKEDYDTMMAQQKGLCAICQHGPIRRSLSVDHDHRTNKVRGLLCFRCNVTLGIYETHRKEFEMYLKRYEEA